jgi:hypothetical protein
MDLLDKYLQTQEELYEYFGYKEDWRVIPIDDARKYFWRLDGETHGDSVRFADAEALLDDEDMNYYENSIYTQRHLPKWVYRGDDFTMICVDTHTDGNQFLQIFDNKKEVK